MKLLSAKAIELINTHELTAELMARDWSVYLPVYDTGIDLLATRQDATEVRRIQLKSRWSIDRRYLDRPIEIAFRDDGTWYLVPHAVAVAAGEAEGYCQTPSWLGPKGQWTVKTMSRSLTARMAPHRLDQVLGKRLVTP